MKILHSYWSKPYFREEADKGGWSHKLFHYMSCALSCLKFNEFFDIELITDKAGKELFIDKLNLPYASVQVVLDDLNEIYPPYLWAIGKLYSYSIQNEPFIHVDNDMFIWEKFRKDILTANLVAHNLEASYSHNKTFFSDIISKFSYIPCVLQDSFVRNNNVVEINAGILGGHDISFIKNYTDEAFDFINRNMDTIIKLNRPGMFNVIYEQFLFYALATQQNKHISYLIEDNVDEHFLGLTDFWQVPHATKYIHTLGAYKTWYIIGEQVAQRLWFEYPEYFNRIINLDKKGLL